MGECEALYKVFPDFHLKKSNVATVYVPVSRKENRSKFLLKIDENINYNGQEKIKIDGRDGYYVEKYDTVSKFERCKGKKDLPFTQFAKMYRPVWKKRDKEEQSNNDYEDDANNENVEENELENIHVESNEKFNYIMKCHNSQDDPNHEFCRSQQSEKLPEYLELSEVFPGEPPFMKKRKSPAV